MKRLTTLSLIAVAAAAMIAFPADAQTRSGSNSRGGSGGGNARNNGGTRPSSSYLFHVRTLCVCQNGLVETAVVQYEVRVKVYAYQLAQRHLR